MNQVQQQSEPHVGSPTITEPPTSLGAVDEQHPSKTSPDVVNSANYTLPTEPMQATDSESLANPAEIQWSEIPGSLQTTTIPSTGIVPGRDSSASTQGHSPYAKSSHGRPIVYGISWKLDRIELTTDAMNTLFQE